MRTNIQRFDNLPETDPITALKWEKKPRLDILWDSKRLGISGEEVFKHLYQEDPRVILRRGFGRYRQGGESRLIVIPTFMQPGDVNVVADRLYRLLSDPPKPESTASTRAPASVAGRWDLRIDFAYGSVDHTLTFAQQGSELSGEHRGELTAGDLSGWIDGDRLHFRDTHTYQAADFSYEFEGTIAGDTAQGNVGLGAYGSARWEAKHRPYV